MRSCNRFASLLFLSGGRKPSESSARTAGDASRTRRGLGGLSSPAQKGFAALAICLAAFFAQTAAADLTGYRWTAEVDVPAGMPVRILAGMDPNPSNRATLGPEVPGRVTWHDHSDPANRVQRNLSVEPDPIAPADFGWLQFPRTIRKGETLHFWYSVARHTKRPPTPGFDVSTDERDVIVQFQNRELLRYAVAERTSGDAATDYLTRSGYVHPLSTLAGDAVTDDFSPDHAHQHGLFFAWTNSRYGQTPTEFWNQHLRKGTIRHAGLGPMGGGPTVGAFEAKQVYRLPETDEPILEETWRARCFAIDDETWLLDLTVEQRALTDVPLVNAKYHYGGLGIRSPREWTTSNSKFLTSQGNGRITGNETRPKWTSLSGPTKSGASTIAVLDHPANFRFPQPVRLHPTMPYFSVAPMAPGEFEVSRERPFAARYGIVVGSKPLDAERLDALQAAFGADATLGWE